MSNPRLTVSLFITLSQTMLHNLPRSGCYDDFQRTIFGKHVRIQRFSDARKKVPSWHKRPGTAAVHVHTYTLAKRIFCHSNSFAASRISRWPWGGHANTASIHFLFVHSSSIFMFRFYVIKTKREGKEGRNCVTSFEEPPRSAFFFSICRLYAIVFINVLDLRGRTAQQ